MPVTMIYSLLSKLFKSDVYDRYTPRPSHLLLSILFMGAGTISWFFDGWVLFGVILFILSILLSLVILFAIGWDKVIEYWHEINEHVRLLSSIKDFDVRNTLLQTLGYKFIPDKVQIIEREETGQGFYNTRLVTVDVPPTNMNLLANKVISSQDLSFTQEKYSNVIPNFRTVQKIWKEKGYITQKNKKNPRLGYTFTQKGKSMLYEYASETIVKMKEKE